MRRAIVIGVSAGGMNALTEILPMLPADFPLPVIIVQHLHPEQEEEFMIGYYDEQCALTVKEAEENEGIQTGYIYFAPPNYHLLVEEDCTFSLSVAEKANYSRPSIDVLFESAVDAYGAGLIGIILTGANADGAQGLQLIRQYGGMIIVQDPQTAEFPYMPRAAIEAVDANHILPLKEIGKLLGNLSLGSRTK